MFSTFANFFEELAVMLLILSPAVFPYIGWPKLR